jgi:hypothetical protein
VPFFRPKTIEAIQFTDLAAAAAWCGGHIKHGIAPAKPADPFNVRDLVELGVCLPDTAPGIYARPTDWIIRRVYGFKVMSDAEFQATYEPASPCTPTA